MLIFDHMKQPLKKLKVMAQGKFEAYKSNREVLLKSMKLQMEQLWSGSIIC